MELIDSQVEPRAGNEHDSPAPIEPEGRHLLELWSDREEVHALPEILRPAEGLVCVGSGTLLRSGRLAQSRWLVVLTDRRLLCIKGRSSVTRKVIEMPVSAIRSVDRSGLFRSTLSFDTGYGTLRITGMKKHIAAELEDGLRTLMRAFGGEEAHVAAIRKVDLSVGPAQRESSSPALSEIVERLEAELGELRDRVAFVEELVRANAGR